MIQVLEKTEEDQASPKRDPPRTPEAASRSKTPATPTAKRTPKSKVRGIDKKLKQDGQKPSPKTPMGKTTHPSKRKLPESFGVPANPVKVVKDIGWGGCHMLLSCA